MGLKDIYYGIEDKWFGLLDWLDEKGIPVYKVVDPLEKRGIPTLPLFIILLIIGGYVLLSAFPTGFGPSPAQYPVTFVLKNIQTDEYLSGAITITNLDTGESTTVYVNGSKEISLKEGTYTATVSIENFTPKNETFSVPEDNTVVLRLAPIAYFEANLSLCFNPPTIDPEEVKVIAYDENGVEQEEFNYEEPFYLEYPKYKFEYAGMTSQMYNKWELRAMVRAGQCVQLTQSPPQETVNLAVLVYDEQTNESIGGINVQVMVGEDVYDTKATSQTGTASFTIPKGANVTINVLSSDQYTFATKHIGIVNEDKTVSIGISLGAQTNITVLEMVGNVSQAVKGAWILVFDKTDTLQAEGYTDKNGHVTFALKKGEGYYVSVYKKGYGMVKQEIIGGGSYTITLQKVSPDDVGGFDVYAYWSDTGLPVRGNVWLKDSEGDYVIYSPLDEGGWARLDGITPGSYTVELRIPDYPKVLSKSYTVEAGTRSDGLIADVSFSVDPIYQKLIVVTYIDNQPIAGVKVKLSWMGGEDENQTQPPRGAALFEIPKDREITIEAHYVKDGKHYWYHEEGFVPGNTKVKEITLYPVEANIILDSIDGAHVDIKNGYVYVNNNRFIANGGQTYEFAFWVGIPEKMGKKPEHLTLEFGSDSDVVFFKDPNMPGENVREGELTNHLVINLDSDTIAQWGNGSIIKIPVFFAPGGESDHVSISYNATYKYSGFSIERSGKASMNYSANKTCHWINDLLICSDLMPISDFVINMPGKVSFDIYNFGDDFTGTITFSNPEDFHIVQFENMSAKIGNTSLSPASDAMPATKFWLDLEGMNTQLGKGDVLHVESSMTPIAKIGQTRIAWIDVFVDNQRTTFKFKIWGNETIIATAPRTITLFTKEFVVNFTDINGNPIDVQLKGIRLISDVFRIAEYEENSIIIEPKQNVHLELKQYTLNFSAPTAEINPITISVVPCVNWKQDMVNEQIDLTGVTSSFYTYNFSVNNLFTTCDELKDYEVKVSFEGEGCDEGGCSFATGGAAWYENGEVKTKYYGVNALADGSSENINYKIKVQVGKGDTWEEKEISVSLSFFKLVGVGISGAWHPLPLQKYGETFDCEHNYCNVEQFAQWLIEKSDNLEKETNAQANTVWIIPDHLAEYLKNMSGKEVVYADPDSYTCTQPGCVIINRNLLKEYGFFGGKGISVSLEKQGEKMILDITAPEPSFMVDTWFFQLLSPAIEKVVDDIPQNQLCTQIEDEKLKEAFESMWGTGPCTESSFFEWVSVRCSSESQEEKCEWLKEAGVDAMIVLSREEGSKYVTSFIWNNITLENRKTPFDVLLTQVKSGTLQYTSADDSPFGVSYLSLAPKTYYAVEITKNGYGEVSDGIEGALENYFEKATGYTHVDIVYDENRDLSKYDVFVVVCEDLEGCAIPNDVSAIKVEYENKYDTTLVPENGIVWIGLFRRLTIFAPNKSVAEQIINNVRMEKFEEVDVENCELIGEAYYCYDVMNLDEWNNWAIGTLYKDEQGAKIVKFNDEVKGVPLSVVSPLERIFYSYSFKDDDGQILAASAPENIDQEKFQYVEVPIKKDDIFLTAASDDTITLSQINSGSGNALNRDWSQPLYSKYARLPPATLPATALLKDHSYPIKTQCGWWYFGKTGPAWWMVIGMIIIGALDIIFGTKWIGTFLIMMAIYFIVDFMKIPSGTIISISSPHGTTFSFLIVFNQSTLSAIGNHSLEVNYSMNKINALANQKKGPDEIASKFQNSGDRGDCEGWWGAYGCHQYAQAYCIGSLSCADSYDPKTQKPKHNMLGGGVCVACPIMGPEGAGQLGKDGLCHRESYADINPDIFDTRCDSNSNIKCGSYAYCSNGGMCVPKIPFGPAMPTLEGYWNTSCLGGTQEGKSGDYFYHFCTPKTS